MFSLLTAVSRPVFLQPHQFWVFVVFLVFIVTNDFSYLIVFKMVIRVWALDCWRGCHDSAFIETGWLQTKSDKICTDLDSDVGWGEPVYLWT